MNIERLSKIPRNGPCPCGSGRKYRKCCLRKNIVWDKKVTLPEEEDIISVDRLKDYGKPHFNEEFFQNNFSDSLTAPVIFYNMVQSPEIESRTVDVMKQYTHRGRKEEKKIRDTKDARQLVEIMKHDPDSLNHPLLVEKILQQEEAALPLILEELKNSRNTKFIELGMTVIHNSTNDYSAELKELLEIAISNPYTISLICVLLGLKGSLDDMKILWDWYHRLKDQFPNRSYAEGALVGLNELWMEGLRLSV